MASRYESDMTRKEKMQLEKEKLSKMNFKENVMEQMETIILHQIGRAHV